MIDAPGCGQSDGDGFDGEQATGLERTTIALAEGAGMREYYDPLTGEGLGSEDFSWTAALVTDMLRG